MSETMYESLEPREVFAWFAAVSRVPRGSHHEKGISDFLMRFAAERDLEAVRDEALNVLVRKPASPGCEKAPAVILQSHMDMVWANADGYAFDFVAEPIRLVADGGRLRSDRTTLGADNGIGMAYALALLASSDIPHPPLEAVFTVAEETGMDGALAFDVSTLAGKYFINADSEDEGVLCCSCCGGTTSRLKMPVEREAADALPDAAGRVFCAIAVDGLKGGHSGMEIDKERGNSNRLLGRVLRDLDERFDIRLADLRGGVVDNAIPASSRAVASVRAADLEAVERRLAAWRDIFGNELKASDGKADGGSAAHAVQVMLTRVDAMETVYSRRTHGGALFAANLLPHGVVAMDLNVEAQRLVETSSNFAMIRDDGDNLVFTVSVRSSLPSKRDFVLSQLDIIAGAVGAVRETGKDYPAWEYDSDSALREIFRRAYAKLYDGATPKVEGVHAGLECGVFSERFKAAGRRVDIISFGPDIRGGHTPDEWADIASIRRTWELLKEVLATIGRGA